MCQGPDGVVMSGSQSSEARSDTLTRSGAYVVVHIIAAGVLLAAAVAKWSPSSVSARTVDGSLPLAVFIAFLVVFEIALAAGLLLASWPPQTKWIPGTCFAAFAAVALFRVLAGAESCGCFGRVKVSPWITLLMDALLAAGLWVWPPGREPVLRLPRLGLMPRVGIVGVVVAVALGLSLWRLPRPVVAVVDGEPTGLLQAGSLTILEPGQWIGRGFPLVAEIDIGDRLRIGRWVAVLHQVHCSTCQEALPFYEAQARDAGGHGVALIEMPPHEGAESHDSHAVRGTLSAGREWFASTPVVLLLEDGMVRDAAEGKPAVALTPDWEAMKLIPAGTDAREAAVVR